MKLYTDLEQSKKLAEFLPSESADMRYGYIAPYDFSDRMYDGGYDEVPYVKDFFKLCADFDEEETYNGSLPCWSLAALFGVLPEGIIENYYAPNLQKEDGKYSIAYGNDELLCIADNPIDACYEMIIKLNELKML